MGRDAWSVWFARENPGASTPSACNRSLANFRRPPWREHSISTIAGHGYVSPVVAAAKGDQPLIEVQSAFFSIEGQHMIEMDALGYDEPETVGLEKVEKLFPDML